LLFCVLNLLSSILITRAFGLVFIFLIASSDLSFAQSIVYLQPKKDQAAVFRKPDFDEKIIYLLPKDKKVLGTRSTVEGLNGLGLFHKVKLSSKTYGYVLDTEVFFVKESLKKKNKKNNEISKTKDEFTSSEVLNQKAKSNVDETSIEPGIFLKDADSEDLEPEEISKEDMKKSKQEEKRLKAEQKIADKAEAKKNKAIANKKEEKLFSFYGDSFNIQKKKKPEGPLFFSTLIGGQVGLINYAEKTQSGKKSSKELVYGIKLSGPNLIFQNFLVDLSFSFHFGAPDFFNDFSTNPSGFFVLTDLTFPFILSRTESRYIYGGFGPMLNTSFFDFKVAGQDESSKRIRLGGVGTFGLAYEIGDSWGFKAEGKYYFESSSYWGVLAGFQKRF
jgi:hypothetical protein